MARSRFLRNILARRIMRRRIADEIKRCFDGIDLTRQSFMMDGKYLKSESGEVKFYSSTEIDTAILRLNTLMNSLRS
jgi:hypothetical protein